MQELEREAEAMRKEREMRRQSVVMKKPQNLTKEKIEEIRNDKEIIEEAVKRKLLRDKEEAERAKTEPPQEFIARLAKAAEKEARKAAFAKGKSTRDAMSLGKAAYLSVKEKYRKQGLTGEQLLEEEEEEERIKFEKQQEMLKAAQIPILATDSAAAARLGVHDREGDLTATKAWREFQDEVRKWDLTGGRNEPFEIREAMAEFLTEKYMCQRLDALAKTIVVTKIRRDMMNVIEKFVAGEEGGDGDYRNDDNNNGADDDDDDDDDDDYDDDDDDDDDDAATVPSLTVPKAPRW